MKYMLYIDYRTAAYPKTYEYVNLKAENLREALFEAEHMHKPNEHYLIQIMEKNGKTEKWRTVKAYNYSAIMEKRSTKWAEVEREHHVKRFVTSNCEWFGSGLPNSL